MGSNINGVRGGNIRTAQPLRYFQVPNDHHQISPVLLFFLPSEKLHPMIKLLSNDLNGSASIWGINLSSCAPKKPMDKLIEPHRRPLAFVAGNRPNGHFSWGIDFFMGKSWFFMGKSQWWWFTAEMGIHISNPCWSVHGNITTLSPLGKVIREMGGLPCLPCRAGGSTISVLYSGVVCSPLALFHSLADTPCFQPRCC